MTLAVFSVLYNQIVLVLMANKNTSAKNIINLDNIFPIKSHNS
jgi:hypothetical protein